MTGEGATTEGEQWLDATTPIDVDASSGVLAAAPGRPSIQRPRLLDMLASRFERRLTLLVAGAGFGKSTLLQQMATDAATVDRGPLVVHRLAPASDDVDLLRGLAEALALDLPAAAPTAALTAELAAQIAEALLSFAPKRPTVIVDDAHHLTDDGWHTIERLLDSLPRNANLVVAGRHHRLRAARRLATGDAAEITEDLLRFTAAELDDFARARQIDRRQLADHGWPALAELTAAGGSSHAEQFAAEEVLAALPADRVHVLRAAALHPHVDDDVLEALGAPVRAAELVGQLPLTAIDGAGRYVLHDLWRDLLVRGLERDERADAHRRLGRHDIADGHLRQAFTHMADADDPDGQRDVLLAYGRDFHLSHPVADRIRIDHVLSDELARTAAGRLLRADIAFATDPARAAPLLNIALDAATTSGEHEIAALAVVRLGDLAYRSGDQEGLADMRRQLEELSAASDPAVNAVAALTEVWAHMLDNAADKALLRLADPGLTAYPPIAAIVDYYRAVQQGFSGRASVALQTLDQLRESPHSRVLDRLGGFASLMRWYLGELSTDERRDTTAIIEQLGRDRQWHLFVEGIGTIALYHLSAGDTATARRLLASAEEARDALPSSSWGSITVELATAIADLVEGDEELAAARLNEIVPSDGPFAGFSRHVFGNVGAVLYALVPRVREFFDGETVGSDLALATDVGRALVALREHGDVQPAARLPWDDIARLRTWAYEPHLLELALAARGAGRHRAGNAIDDLRADRRSMLERIVAATDDGRKTIATAAADLLAVTPSRPDHVTEVRVLGTLEVRRDGTSLSGDAPMRRGTVRDLVMLLAHHRQLTRAEAIATLWPDKDERSGQNNLRTTLSHTRTLLEAPDAPGNLPWHMRSIDDLLVLHESDRLIVDVELFWEELDAARAADRERHPVLALRHYLNALELVRGTYAADASNVEWAAHARLRVTLAEVEACTRASELLTAGTPTTGTWATGTPATGMPSRAADPLDAAVDFASRAVDREPLSERSHRALIRARLANGDRAGALRCHQRVLELLDAEDLRPESETIRLVSEL